MASVARSGLAITFSGTAVQVGKAFRTTIVDYDLDGVKRHGNATPISLPRGLAAFADGVVSLNDLGRRSLARKAGPLAWNRGTPPPRVGPAPGGHGIRRQRGGPGDFAAIMAWPPCSRPAPPAPASPSGWWDGATWRPVTGPPSPTPSGRVSFRPGSTGSLQVVHNGTDPGITSPDEEFEADTDTQWATAAAPGATIDFVVSASSYTTDGADLSAQYPWTTCWRRS